MVFLELFVKIMLLYIDQDIHNSHFCDNRVCCFMYGCFCALFIRKFTQKHPYNWGSDILVLLKCLAGRRGFDDVLYNFL